MLFAFHAKTGDELRALATALLGPVFGHDGLTLLCFDCYETPDGLRHLGVFTSDPIIDCTRRQRLAVERSRSDASVDLYLQYQEGFHPTRVAGQLSSDESYTVLYESGDDVSRTTIRFFTGFGELAESKEGSGPYYAFEESINALNGNVHHLKVIPSGTPGQPEPPNGYAFTAIHDLVDFAPSDQQRPGERFRWRGTTVANVAFETSVEGFYGEPVHKAMAAGMVRPQCVSPLPGFDGPSNGGAWSASIHALTTLWHGTSLVPFDGVGAGPTPSAPKIVPENFRGGTRVVGPFLPHELQTRVDMAAAEGFWPLNIAANTWGSMTWVLLVLAPAGRRCPLPKRVTVRSLRDELPPISNSILDPYFAEIVSARFQALVVGGTRSSIDPSSSSLAELLDAETDALERAKQIGPRLPHLPAARLQHLPGGGAAVVERLSDTLHRYPVDAIHASPWLPPIAPVDVALDAYLIPMLKASGAHALQVGVAINGKLKYLKAFTYAEDAYPTCGVRNNLYFASALKPLLASILVRLMGPTGVRNTRVLDALGAGPPEPVNQGNFNLLTVEKLMRHRGHIKSETEIQNILRTVATDPSSPLKPGDYARYMPLATQPVFVFEKTPGAPPEYSNPGYDILGEIASAATYGFPSFFLSAFQDFFSGMGIIAAPSFHLRYATWQQGLMANDALRHELRPWWAQDLQTPELLLPNVLHALGGFDAGSGEFVMPVGEFTRIVSSLSSGAALTPLLSQDELDFLSEPYVDELGNLYDEPFGFGRAEWGPDRARLWGFGAYLGCVAGFDHVYRLPGIDITKPEITLVWAFDTGSLVQTGDSAAILSIIDALVLQGVWLENEDLFDLL